MWELSRIPLDSRTELVQVTRKKDSVLMRTVELWQRGGSLQECFRQRSGHMDKPVLNVRANLHKYKMKLLLVWGPRLCHESPARRSRHNILLFSRIEGQTSRCVIEQTGTDALSLS